MEIDKIIKNRRKLLKITQQDLADIAGVSIRTYIAIENGKYNPSLKILSKIADTLGMEVTLTIKNLNNK